eukprot:546031-Prorocentrum_minimum.AAC.1
MVEESDGGIGLVGCVSECSHSFQRIPVQHLRKAAEPGPDAVLLVEDYRVFSSGLWQYNNDTRRVWIWDLAERRLLFKFGGVSEWVARGFGCALSANGELALTCTWDRKVQGAFCPEISMFLECSLNVPWAFRGLLWGDPPQQLPLQILGG